MSMVRRWWDQPDQFDWVTAFLRQREYLRPTRQIMAVVSASSFLVPLSVLLSLRHPSATALLVGALGSAFTAAMAVFWLTRWPTRRLSEFSVTFGSLFVGGWSVAQPSPAIAALACTATAVTGGYIAFFHSVKLLAVNAAIALVAAVSAAVRLAEEADVATAVGAFWLIFFLNVSVSLGVRAMSRAMREYAERSDEDPLTGLLNRRGFVNAVSTRVGGPDATGHLVVLMADIDNFKRINDEYGHAAGDRALLAVAELLRQHLPADAAICRAGGEEFLVALTLPDADTAPIAARLCTAIAGLPQGITASVGAAACHLRALGADRADRIEALIATADMAMYTAKRRGGNQVQHAH